MRQSFQRKIDGAFVHAQNKSDDGNAEGGDEPEDRNEPEDDSGIRR